MAQFFARRFSGESRTGLNGNGRPRRRNVHRDTRRVDASRRCRNRPVFSLIVSFLIRLSLVALFLPFSALDKLLNPIAAVNQADRGVHSRKLAWLLIGLGLTVEVVMSAAVLTGYLDRLAAVILAGYCAVTALLWKPFWKTGDFRLKGPSKGRDVFWDFLKNFAVAGGFLVLATGGTALGVSHFLHHPLSSSQPYSTTAVDAYAAPAGAVYPSPGASP
jgi:putative oxidoreductase